MQIQNRSFFISAYQTRLMERHKTTDLFGAAAKEGATRRLNAAIADLKEKRGEDAVIVTMSEEAKRYLQSGDAQLQMLKDTAEMYVNSAAVNDPDPKDAFSARANDQWAVFSEYLNGSGFYDGLSDEEMGRMETMLMRITDGLDSLNREGAGWYSGIEMQLDSNEANLELESSTAALAYFSAKYVASDKREGFNALVAAYYKHNKEIVKGYQSIEERFNAARAKLPESTKRRMDRERESFLGGARAARAAKDLAVRNFLGGISRTDDTFSKNNALYAQLFDEIKDVNGFQSTLEQVRGQYLAFASNGSGERDIRDYIDINSAVTFSRIQGYWTELLVN